MCPLGSIEAVSRICNEWQRLPSRSQHSFSLHRNDAILISVATDVERCMQQHLAREPV